MFNNDETINSNKCRLPMQLVLSINPYIINSLQNLIGEDLIIDTIKGEYRGLLEDVKIDELVPYYICLHQIVAFRADIGI